MNLPDSCDDKECVKQIKNPHQGICPKGFHVPTNDEFSTLYSFIGGAETAGPKLKSKTGWVENGNYAIFRSATEISSGCCVECFYSDLIQDFTDFDEDVKQLAFDKRDAYSLRCLKD